MEWSLLREVVRYADEKQCAPVAQAAAKLALGRFLEPTIVRLIKNNPAKNPACTAANTLCTISTTRNTRS